MAPTAGGFLLTINSFSGAISAADSAESKIHLRLLGGPGLFFLAMKIILEDQQKNGDHTFNFPRAVVGEI